MKKRIATVVLSSIMIFSLRVNYNLIEVQAKTAEDYKQEIDKNNSQKQELEQQKNEVINQQKTEQNKLDKIQEQLENKSDELDLAKEKLNQVSSTVSRVKTEVEQVQDKIDKLNTDIEKNEKEITKVEDEIEESEKLLGLRIRTMYKMNYAESFVQLLLTSRSISEGLDRAMSFAYFVRNDKQLIEKVSNMRKDLLSQKEKLNNNKKDLDNQKREAIDKQKKLEEQMALEAQRKSEISNQYASIQSLENEKTEIINSLSQKEKELNDKIGDISSYNKELQAQLDKIFASVNNNNNNSGNNDKPNNNNGGSSQGYMRPVSGGYISCAYGPRIHPVNGTYGFHTGIDIAVPQGTPIYASHDGVVAAARWNTAYGNMVILNNGNGVQTLYGHATRYIVSVGQTVKKGQVIAYVGSTGWSTGPHLHYEVRINGQHVNPGPYM